MKWVPSMAGTKKCCMKGHSPVLPPPQGKDTATMQHKTCWDASTGLGVSSGE